MTKCRKITDQSLDYIDRMSNIRILTLNYCPLITNYGLLKIPSLYEKLEVLSLEGLALISDEGLEGVIQKCRNLVVLNVNNCPNISCDSVQAIARKNSRLHTIHTSGIMITDNDLSVLASIVKGKTVTSIDISFCSSITDYGLISLSEACPMIKYLNIRGLNRVSDKGVKAVCAKCWFLSYLNLEDIFLLRDDAFWFDASFDGRAAANESMLLSLRILNMTDCVNLTDHGIEGLAERSRSIESLVVRGCDRLTDKALAMMSDPCISTHSQVAMCDSFKILSIAFCSGFSSLGMLTMLGSCGILEELNLSGLTTVVTDAFIHQLCATCSTLQRLVLQKCTFLTDAALCSISDFLWIEEIDVSGCVKLTDKGLEVLTEACSGIRSIAARGNRKLSDKAVYAIMRNCTNLRALDLRDCPMITENALRTIKAVNKRIRIA